MSAEALAALQSGAPLSERTAAELDAACATVVNAMGDADSPDTRRLAATIAEEIGRTRTPLVARLMPALPAVLTDGNVSVAKRGLLTATALLRPALALVCDTADSDAAAAAALWRSVGEVRAQALELLRSTGADAVRRPPLHLSVPAVQSRPPPRSRLTNARASQVVTQAVKLLTVSVLAFTDDGAAASAAPGAPRSLLFT